MGSLLALIPILEKILQIIDDKKILKLGLCLIFFASDYTFPLKKEFPHVVEETTVIEI